MALALMMTSTPAAGTLPLIQLVPSFQLPSVTNILSVSVVNSLLADHSGSGSEQALSAT